MRKKAQSLIEYALILALVTLVAITALSLLGKKVNSAVDKTGSQIEAGTDKAGAQYCQSLGGTYNNGICEGVKSSGETPETGE